MEHKELWEGEEYCPVCQGKGFQLGQIQVEETEETLQTLRACPNCDVFESDEKVSMFIRGTMELVMRTLGCLDQQNVLSDKHMAKLFRQFVHAEGIVIGAFLEHYEKVEDVSSRN